MEHCTQLSVTEIAQKENLNLGDIEQDVKVTETSPVCIAAKLPVEILLDIFKYLSQKDLIAVRRVCTSWYAASHDPTLRQDEILVIEQDLQYPLHILTRADFKHFDYLFREVEFRKSLWMEKFWKGSGEYIKSLIFENCYLGEKMLVEILLQCPNLVTLKLIDLNEAFMLGRAFPESEHYKLTKCLHNVKELSLANNRFMSDALFYRIASMVTSMTSLDLTELKLSFHPGIYKRFYPEHLKSKNSDSVLTFQKVMEFCQSKVAQIKKLDFSHTLIDCQSLGNLCQMPGLQLESLSLRSCDQLTKKGILFLCNFQNKLTELNLEKCSRITDPAIITIAEKMKHLEKINVNSCRSLTDDSISQLFSLPNLKELDFSSCDAVRGLNINLQQPTDNSKTLEVNHNKLLKLNCSSLSLEESFALTLTSKCTQLVYIDLSSCYHAVTDQVVQNICKHLILLRTLKLASCEKITDIGITGCSFQLEKSQLMHDPDLFVPQEALRGDSGIPAGKTTQISMRSRVEKELWSDFNRNQAIQQMCEDIIQEREYDTSLTNLKGLRHLDLGACNRITDTSIKYAIKFLELQYLNINRCQQVTDTGLFELGVHNPSLQTLILSNCYNITDVGVIELLKHLPRLNNLQLESCSQLTDNIFKTLSDYCKELKFLDVRSCKGMTTDGIINLRKQIPSLRHTLKTGIMKSDGKPKNWQNGNMGYIPPLPALRINKR